MSDADVCVYVSVCVCVRVWRGGRIKMGGTDAMEDVFAEWFSRGGGGVGDEWMNGYG